MKFTHKKLPKTTTSTIRVFAITKIWVLNSVSYKETNQSKAKFQRKIIEPPFPSSQTLKFHKP